MSLKTVLAMFVSCMAPIFLVYFVVDGIYVLQLDKTTYVSEKPKFDGPTKFKAYIVLCVAFVVPCTVLSIYIAMFGRRKRAEEHARRKTMFGDVRKDNKREMQWFDINLLKDDVDSGDEDDKRFHFFDVYDEIGDVGLKSGSSEDNIGMGSLGSASGLGWCELK